MFKGKKVFWGCGIAVATLSTSGLLAQTCQSPTNGAIPSNAFDVPGCAAASGEAFPHYSFTSDVPANAFYMQVGIGLAHSRVPDLDLVLINPSASKYLILASGNGPTLPVNDAFGPNFADGNFPSISGCNGNCGDTYRPLGGSYTAANPWPFTSVSQPSSNASTLAEMSQDGRNGCWMLLIFDRNPANVSFELGGIPETHCSVGQITQFSVQFSDVRWDGIVCDSIDFNNDGLFPDDLDLADFVAALAGNPCSTCNDIDFNNDGLFPDDNDLIAFLSVLAGGPC